MKRKRYFQWIAGEDIGNIAVLESIEQFDGETFYNFDDGESCNLRFISKMTSSVADLKEKFMVEIDNPSNPWTFETVKSKRYTDQSMNGEYVEIPSLHDRIQADGTNTSMIQDSDIGKEKLVPPKNPQRFVDLPSIDEYPVATQDKCTITTESVAFPEQPVQQNNTQSDESVTKQAGIKIGASSVQPVMTQAVMDPIRILVNSCKKHETAVDMTLSIKLPSKYIYNIAASEFEDGIDKFINCIVSDIDVSMIIDQLKNALRLSYSSDKDSEN
jgi:hypothetical protein